ncbi:hypothetical protein BLNAU_20471 [Blattamonas nauphoetae]|uniref:Uncharacterized protein n=1 Tax=Blattamonas nauphoetae TaxID=2049346 RepID=A0ABQ9WZ80_9EUKA|nr:hypothetical protein BLNAU_20471 [Blattamonas nauphoetae]
MHRRFVDFEGFDVERNQCESDIRSIRLRSSRRIGLRQENPLDRPRQIFVHHLFGLSTSLEKEDNDSLLSTLSSIQFLTENSDNDEIVTVFLQENVIDKLLGIVSLHEDGAVLNAVYSLLARLTCVSAAVVSKIMVPDFLSTSLSLLSSADDGLTLIVLNVLYNSAVAGDDYCAFEVENDVTAHLLRYLLTCQPSTVVRNEKSCCGRLELEESRQQTIATCLLLLTELIKVSFPEALKEEVVTGCVPYFLSGNRHVQLLALKYARHFVSNSENEYFLQFSLPNNQMNASDPTRITVLSYLVDLLREKQIDYEQNARVFHVFRRVCADINDQLMDPERTTRAEPSCLRTVESDMMSVFQNCLKTIGTILAIFGELAYFSEEHEQVCALFFDIV